MRVLVADTYYPAFLDDWYARHEGLSQQPYKEQLASLLASGFGTSDAYSRGLREAGHEADDLILNCAPLQRGWAEERARFGPHRAAARLLPGPLGRAAGLALRHRVGIAQIADHRPDLLYLQDLRFFRPAELRRIKKAGVALVGQISSVPPGDEVLRWFDLLVTSFPHFVERFRDLGVDSEYLRIAFDGQVRERLREQGVEISPDRERPRDVSFVGGYDFDAHPWRYRLLEEVASEIEIELWGYGAEELPEDSAIRARYRGQAWGLEMYRILAESRIVINAHEEVGRGHANNMRLYEATGAGALLVTENYDNLPELFDPGREVVTFEDAGDLVEKVRHYLEHEQERQRIAAAGQARTLAEHTYERRIEQLLPWLERARQKA